MFDQPERVLIVGPAWVGDMVMAQSLYIALKQKNPDCHIDVIAPSWTLPLLSRMPQVSKAILMDLPRGKLGLVERIQLGKTLRTENYQQAILLTNTWKSALTPFFANISLRTGYVGEWRWGLLNDIRHLNKSILTQTVQRFVALGERNQATQPPVCPQPRLEVSLRQQQQVLQKYQLNIERKVLALCPGAEYGDAKRWPVEHFAQVAEYCLDRDWQVWLFGSPKDTEVAADINRRVSDQCVDLTGKTSITEAVDLLSLTDTVVSNDSGLMHVAAALNRKLIALYGSSDPEFTPPLSQDAQILRLGLECSPCFQRTCPLGHKRCLVDISPQQVLTAII